MFIYEFVESLSDDIRLQIIEDYERFCQDGVIGDCVLRTTAEEIMKKFGSNQLVVLWMEHLAIGCYRYYALKYLSNIK